MKDATTIAMSADAKKKTTDKMADSSRTTTSCSSSSSHLSTSNNNNRGSNLSSSSSSSRKRCESRHRRRLEHEFNGSSIVLPWASTKSSPRWKLSITPWWLCGNTHSITRDDSFPISTFSPNQWTEEGVTRRAQNCWSPPWGQWWGKALRVFTHRSGLSRTHSDHHMSHHWGWDHKNNSSARIHSSYRDSRSKVN